MAKGAYVGVNNIARKIKKGYVGVDGKARRIKKAYVGIGGVARPCWSGGELTYYGRLNPVAGTGTYVSMDCGSVGDYALFTGGNTAGGSKSYKYTYALNNSLTFTQLSTQTPSSYKLYQNVSGINFDGKLFFQYSNTWVSYDSSLTLRTNYTSWSIYSNCGVATIGDYMVLVGGYNYDTSKNVAVVKTINKSWTYDTLDNVSVAGERQGANNSNYAVFPIADWANDNKAVDAYDSSLTRTSASTISKPTTIAINKNNLNNFNNYAIFTNNYNNTSDSNSPIGYNGSLTQTNLPALSSVRLSTIPVTLGEYAVFIGEYTSSNNSSSGSYANRTADGTVDYYDKSFVRASATPLPTSRYEMPVACTKDFLIAGMGITEYDKDDGYFTYNYYDAYTIA